MYPLACRMYFGDLLTCRWTYFGGDMYLFICQVDVLWWSYLSIHMSGGCILVELCTYSHVGWMYFGGVIYLFTCQVDELWWGYLPTHVR